MRRREFIAVLGATAAWPLAARAQQLNKVWRIGMLETVAAPLKAAEFEAFRSGLEGLGYVEPRDVKIEYRSADGHPDRFTTLAQELINLKVEISTTTASPATAGVQSASSSS